MCLTILTLRETWDVMKVHKEFSGIRTVTWDRLAQQTCLIFSHDVSDPFQPEGRFLSLQEVLTFLFQQVCFSVYSVISWRCIKGIQNTVESGYTRFTPGNDPVPIVQEAGWAPGPVWTGAENLSSTGIRSPDRPARRFFRSASFSGLELLDHCTVIRT